MANLILKIKNSKFVDSNGLYQTSFSEKKVVGNGWIALIEDNGAIKCQAKKKYSDGEYELRYNVQRNGYAKLTLKTPRMEKAKTLRKGFIVPKGKKIKNGELTLTGGRIDERFAYFRSESFVNLLNKYSLKGIERKNPNREYTMIDLIQYGVHRSDSIFTDGITQPVSKKIISNFAKSKDRIYECKVKVEDAKWVIICSKGKRFLYTLEDNIDSLGLDTN